MKPSDNGPIRRLVLKIMAASLPIIGGVVLANAFLLAECPRTAEMGEAECFLLFPPIGIPIGLILFGGILIIGPMIESSGRK